MRKYKFLTFIITSALFLFLGYSQNAHAGDALAIRVMENNDHSSIMSWYNEFVENKGAPQELTVDGYDAIRDGRTVYVNAGNIESGALNTYVYIISYSQEPAASTMDIFGRILEHWKFNTNGYNSTAGNCKASSTDSSIDTYCMIDSDCDDARYCNSEKSQIVRDVKRLGDIGEIEKLLIEYNDANGNYPELLAGTYVTGTSYSLWPSWQDNFSSQLGKTLPVDPLNIFYGCSYPYNEQTCWDEINKEFNITVRQNTNDSKYYNYNYTTNMIYWKMERTYAGTYNHNSTTAYDRVLN